MPSLDTEYAYVCARVRFWNALGDLFDNLAIRCWKKS